MTAEPKPPHRAGLLRVADTADRVIRWLGQASAWLSLLMVLVTFLVVVLRYAFDQGSIALQESVTYMHASLFMLAIAYTLGRDGHVRVDILYQRLSQRGRAWVDLAGTLLLLVPVCLLILWLGWDYVLQVLAPARGLPGGRRARRRLPAQVPDPDHAGPAPRCRDCPGRCAMGSISRGWRRPSERGRADDGHA